MIPFEIILQILFWLGCATFWEHIDALGFLGLNVKRNTLATVFTPKGTNQLSEFKLGAQAKFYWMCSDVRLTPQD